MAIFGFILLVVLLTGLSISMKWGKSKKKYMWEILVPASSKEQEFSYEHHKKWDEYVKSLAGGLTILKTAKGEWINPNGISIADRVIPVRIRCKKKHIKKIINFTLSHYNQQAVLAYRVSDKVIVKYNAEKYLEKLL